MAHSNGTADVGLVHYFLQHALKLLNDSRPVQL